jgi:hypothetical protein
MKAQLGVILDDFVVRKCRYLSCLPYNLSMNQNSAFIALVKFNIQPQGISPLGALSC